MNSALVDVVIPNYERTDKLLMAVQSVLIQGKAINKIIIVDDGSSPNVCLLYTSPSPRDRQKSRMPSSA